MVERNTQVRQEEISKYGIKNTCIPLEKKIVKISPKVWENGHSFVRISDVMQVVHYSKMGVYIDVIEKRYIYKETEERNQRNNRHTVSLTKFSRSY
jgi:hypothetical protein